MKKVLAALLILCVILSTSYLDISRANPMGSPNVSYIYIRSDGSIEPSETPIQKVIENQYQLISNITGIAYSGFNRTTYSIIIERDNIVLDGANHTLYGMGAQAIRINSRHNVTIKNISVSSYQQAIDISFSSKINIIGNSISKCKYVFSVGNSSQILIANNSFFDNSDQTTLGMAFCSSTIIYGNTLSSSGIGGGMVLSYCSNNYIIANNVTNYVNAIRVLNSSNNLFLQNNIVGNMRQYVDESLLPADPWEKPTVMDFSVNTWNSNYWSNFSPSLFNSSYKINQYNVDNSPLSKPANTDQVVPLDTVNPSNMILAQNKQMFDTKLYVGLAIVILAVIILVLLALFYRRRKRQG